MLWKMTQEQYVTSPLSGRDYNVLSGYDDKIEAAKMLDHLDNMNKNLIKYLNDKYGSKKGTYQCMIATKLKQRWIQHRLKENSPQDKWNTSYTQNKGDVIALCLREKVTGYNTLHSQNILEFVDLHELSHVASESYDHPDEFWENFYFLLDEAKQAGIHEPIDYSKRPINYCMMEVNYNPYYDKNLAQRSRFKQLP